MRPLLLTLLLLLGLAGCGKQKTTTASTADKPLLLTGQEFSKVGMLWREFSWQRTDATKAEEVYKVGGRFFNDTEYEIESLTYVLTLKDYAENVISEKEFTVTDFKDLREGTANVLLPKAYSSAYVEMRFPKDFLRSKQFQSYWMELKSAKGFKKHKDKNHPANFLIPVCKGDTKEVKRMLDEDPKLVDVVWPGGTTKAIHFAAARDHIEIFKLLVAKGAKLDEKKSKAFQPIHIAAGGGATKVLKFLLEKGIDAEVSNETGYVPLTYASIYADEPTIKLLHQAGANLNWQNHQGNTSIMMAISEYRGDTVATLLKLGADPNLKDKQGFTALHKVAFRDRVDIAESLVKAGARVNEPLSKENPQTPLHCAVANNQVRMAQFLVSKGADKKAKNQGGMNASQLAEYYKFNNLALLLR